MTDADLYFACVDYNHIIESEEEQLVTKCILIDLALTFS